MAKQRTCVVCGKKYEYCLDCHTKEPVVTWKYLFDNETCKNICEIRNAYKGKEISRENAIIALKAYGAKDIVKGDGVIATEIKELLKEETVKAPVVEEKKEEAPVEKVEPVEEAKVEEVKIEEPAPKKTSAKGHNSKFRKNDD